MPRKKPAVQSDQPKKPRKSRSKKAAQPEVVKEEATAVAAEVVQAPPADAPEAAAFTQAVDLVIEAAQDRQEAARMDDVSKQLGKELGSQPGMETANGHADAEERAAIQEEGTHASRVLTGAKPRKSGRRPWDLNRGTPGHCWERQTTPDDGEVIFKFKDRPDDQQMELIARFGFTYDENAREAYQPNDPDGRQNADRLAWFLKEYQRSQPAALSL